MGSISNFLENAMLNHIFKVTPFTPNTDWFLALCTASVSDTNTGANLPEVANAGSYVRKSIGAMSTAASRATTNETDIAYDQATGDWGTVTYWAVTDSATYGAGNSLAWGAFTTPKTVLNGNTAKVLIGDLDIAVSASGASTYLANKMLDHSFKNTAFTVPTNLYIGLATASIVDADTTFAEPPTANAYGRELHNSWQTSSAGVTNNYSSASFDTATGAWGTISHTFISDADTAGNMLVYGPVGTPQPITTNDVVEFATGSLVINLD